MRSGSHTSRHHSDVGRPTGPETRWAEGIKRSVTRRPACRTILARYENGRVEPPQLDDVGFRLDGITPKGARPTHLCVSANRRERSLAGILLVPALP